MVEQTKQISKYLQILLVCAMLAIVYNHQQLLGVVVEEEGVGEEVVAVVQQQVFVEDSTVSMAVLEVWHVLDSQVLMDLVEQAMLCSGSVAVWCWVEVDSDGPDQQNMDYRQGQHVLPCIFECQ